MKNTIKALSVIVLIGISVFFAVTYYKTFIKDEVNAENSNTINGVQTEPPPTTNTDNVEQTPPKVFRSEFPKTALTLSDGYINNIGGYNKEEFKEYYYLSNRYFVIMSSLSDNCDVYDNGSGICIATIDNNGSLLSTQSLKSDDREKFLTSSLYDDGIMIVTTSSNRVNIYGYSLGGSISKLSLPFKAISAISYYSNSNNVVVCLGESEMRVVSITSSLSINYEISLDSLGVNKPIALFKSGSYTLFANSDSGGRIFTFDFAGNTNVIKTNIIKDIIPTEEGYLVGTNDGGNLMLTRYSYSLDKINSFNLAVGDECKIGRAENGYLIIVYGANKQTVSYFLCKHFDIVSINKSDYLGFSDIGEVITIGNNIFFKGINIKSNYLYVYDTNNHSAKSLLNIDNAVSLKYTVTPEKITLFFTSFNTIGDYKNCWGESDVWIKSQLLNEA